MTRPDRHGLLPDVYPWSHLKADVVAGLTTAVVLIPQAMAYALLAGLPPVSGLYASVVPLVAYAWFGTSRVLAVGPVALDSLLTAATIGLFAASGTARYVELAALLALVVGMIQLGLGAVRAGFLIHFLSQPVIKGFTSAAALVIAMSQLPSVLGLQLPRPASIVGLVSGVAGRLGQIHLLTLSVSVGCIAILEVMKRWSPNAPRALVVVLVAGGAAWAGLAEHGLAVIQQVPPGLPLPDFPRLDLETFTALVPGAFAIALVAFVEVVSISTALNARDAHRIEPNREFQALGFANLAAGVFSGYPVAGGLSRTALNAEAGAKSKVAGLITAAAVAFALSFLTAGFSFIPQASLSAIIVVAVAGLIDFREPVRLWSVKRTDFWMLVATFLATLVLGIQQGVVTGVVLSLLSIVLGSARPHVAVLGEVPGTRVYKNSQRYPQAVCPKGILVLRIDAQLYFANVGFLRDNLHEYERKHETPLRGVVLDASGVNQIDSSAEHGLRAIAREYRERSIPFIVASAKGQVRDVLERSGFAREHGADGFSLCVHDAVLRLTEAPTRDPSSD